MRKTFSQVGHAPDRRRRGRVRNTSEKKERKSSLSGAKRKKRSGGGPDLRGRRPRAGAEGPPRESEITGIVVP